MMNRVWHKAAIALLGSVVLFISAAHSASLEKIEVASKLGEPFYAEVPLKLEENELVSKVFVEIAAASDYRIFEVYRDSVLDSIRADVSSDERGARVKLTSRSTIKAPFFNLVLKIRYGRVSHFKKFPVFLDAAKTIQQASAKQPQPSVQAVQPTVDAAAQPAMTETAGTAVDTTATGDAAPAAEKPKVAYFDGWARTAKYGPIVRGDSLSTVAERLRIDLRYTRNQIMLALFEKNRASFEQDNMNLMKAGSFLQVPTAAEIEQHNKAESYRAFKAHEKAWQELTSEQPRYAAAAEAQRTRYSKRVRVGEQADGVATAPVSSSDSASASTTPAQVTDLLQSEPAADSVADSTKADAAVTPADSSATAAQSETNQMLAALQEQNELLQQQLLENQKHVEALNQKVDDVASAASRARIEKLEILMTRLQAELEKDRRQPVQATVAGPDWVLWLLIALVVVLLGVVAVLMRREPAHPATTVEKQPQPAAPVEQSGESEALAAAIEDEVAGIETGEMEQAATEETATIDSLPVFTDELSDTDTAELEPFDADTQAEPDPNIDYLSEADVYIRYGMDEEALQQLDMALKLEPENVEAHIKKAELLLGKNDKHGFDETIAAATLTLAAVDLDHFKSSIEELGGVSGEVAIDPELEEPLSDDATVPLNEGEDLDFDLSDMDVPDIGSDRIEAEQDQSASDEADDDSMDWLHDVEFDGEPESAAAETGADSESLPDASVEEDEAVQAGETIQIEGATQHLNNLLGEFPGDETRKVPADEESAATQELDNLLTEFSTDEDEPDSAVDSESGATQELDNLLTEFSTDEDEKETALTEGEAGATQQLDNLLSEFDDDEDLDFVSTGSGFDAAVIEQGISDAEDADAIGIDTDHGATQELDNLLAEFADEDDQASDEGVKTSLDDSFFEPSEKSPEEPADAIGTDTDHGATQELDNLLSEFSDDDEAVNLDNDQDAPDAESIEQTKLDEGANEQENSGQGATQVLGHLLDEFKDEDEEDDKKD